MEEMNTKDILYLNKLWNRAYCTKEWNVKKCGYFINEIIKNVKNINNDLITNHIHIDGTYLFLTSNDKKKKNIEFSNQSSWCSCCKFINKLMHVISINSSNGFDSFMVEWHKVMLLNQQNMDVYYIAHTVHLYEDKHLNHHHDVIYSFDDIKASLIQDAELLVDAESYDGMTELSILRAIMGSDNWNTLIKQSVENNTPINNTNNMELVNYIKRNASQIAKNGTKYTRITKYLAHFNTMSGFKLQRIINDKMNQSNDFQEIRHLGCALGNITNPYAMYHFSSASICDLRKLDGHALIHIINAHNRLNIQPYYKNLLKEQKRINNKVNKIKKQYDF